MGIDIRIRSSSEALNDVQIPNDEGLFVQLSSFCSFKKRPGVWQVNRFNDMSSD